MAQTDVNLVGSGFGSSPLAAAAHIDIQRPAGPVANAYEQSRARVAAIVGPTGGGKTVASCKRCLRVAQWQQPSPRDGVRKARVYVIMPTYRALWRTIIPSFLQVMAPYLAVKGCASFVGSKGDPADFTLSAMIPRMGPIYLEVLFRATGDENLEEFMRGLEATAFMLPEMDTQPEDLVGLASNRVGRYPPPVDRPEGAEPGYMGVFGDANVPDIDSWFYSRFWLPDGVREGWHVFRQPSGYSPDAENLQNLRKISPDYYGQMAKNMEPWAVRRFIECKPGYSRHGTPVHPDFDDDRHVSKVPLSYASGLVVQIGVDGGGNTLMPAAVFGQQDYVGRWSIPACFAPQTQTSVDELGEQITRELNARASRAKGALIWIDPAAQVRSPQSPFTYAQQLQSKTGIEVRPAPSNALDARRSPLRRVLQRSVDTRPALVVDGEHAAPLVRALSGGWHIEKKVLGRGEAKPDKGKHSHVGEACEYLIQGGEGVEGMFEPHQDISPSGFGRAADYAGAIL